MSLGAEDGCGELRKLRALAAEHDSYAERRRAAVRDAVAAGLPKSTIAAELGVTRATVYADLR